MYPCRGNYVVNLWLYQVITFTLICT